jgi:hypothetical protein
MGNQQGIRFTRNLVYLVRGPRGRERPPTAHANVGAGAAASLSASSEIAPTTQRIALLMLEFGLDRTEALLAKLKSVLA